MNPSGSNFASRLLCSALVVATFVALFQPLRASSAGNSQIRFPASRWSNLVNGTRERYQSWFEPSDQDMHEAENRVLAQLEKMGLSPDEARDVLKAETDPRVQLERLRFDDEKQRILKDVLTLYRSGVENFSEKTARIKEQVQKLVLSVKDQESEFQRQVAAQQFYKKLPNLGRVEVLIVEGKAVYQVTHKASGIIYLFLEGGKEAFFQDWENRLNRSLQKEFAKTSPATAIERIVAKVHIDAPWDFSSKVLGRDIFTVFVNRDIRTVKDIDPSEIDFHPIPKKGTGDYHRSYSLATFYKPNYLESSVFALLCFLTQGGIMALATALGQYLDPDLNMAFLEALQLTSKNPEGATIVTKTGQSVITSGILSLVFGIWSATYSAWISRGTEFRRLMKSLPISLSISVPLRIINKGIESFTWLSVGELLMNFFVKTKSKLAAQNIINFRRVLGLNQHNIAVSLPGIGRYQTKTISAFALESQAMYLVPHTATAPHVIGLPGSTFVLLAITPILDFIALWRVRAFLKSHPDNERLKALEASIAHDIDVRYLNPVNGIFKIMSHVLRAVGLSTSSPLTTFRSLKDWLSEIPEHMETLKKNQWAKLEAKRLLGVREEHLRRYRNWLKENFELDQQELQKSCESALKNAS